MAIPPASSASAGSPSTWIARADPRPAPSLQQDSDRYNAFVKVTSLGWLVGYGNPGADYLKLGRLDPKAFTNAKALLGQHGAALRGPADGMLSTGDLTRMRKVDVTIGRPPAEPNDPHFFDTPVPAVDAYERAHIRDALATLKRDGYDMAAVTSPRVQLLVGLDITLARWKNLFQIDAGRPRAGLQNITHSIEAAGRVVAYGSAGVQKAVMNEVAAARKSEFVQAVREYDRAKQAESQAHLGRKDEKITFGTLASRVEQRRAAEHRLDRAEKALFDLTRALDAQVRAGAVDMGKGAFKIPFHSEPAPPRAR